MKIRIAMAAAVMALAAGAAQAVPVNWTLDGWAFDDGGMAQGGFTFDADVNAYSGISVVTSGGTISQTFTMLDPGSTSDASGFGLGDGFSRSLLAFFGPLTDAGGTVDVLNYSEFDFGNFALRSNDTAASPRLIGTPTVGAVPLPAGLPLLLGAFAAFGLTRRRRG